MRFAIFSSLLSPSAQLSVINTWHADSIPPRPLPRQTRDPLSPHCTRLSARGLGARKRQIMHSHLHIWYVATTSEKKRSGTELRCSLRTARSFPRVVFLLSRILSSHFFPCFFPQLQYLLFRICGINSAFYRLVWNFYCTFSLKYLSRKEPRFRIEEIII